MNESVRLKSGLKAGELLYIFASFEHSTYLELALAMLEEQGVKREHILAVPIEKRKPRVRLFDTIHSSDNFSLFDLGVPLSTAFAVIGASYGFILAWGPIIWGLIGAMAGIITGTGISLIRYFRRHGHEKRLSQKKVTEVIVMVHCGPEEADRIETTLWDHFAYGVGKLQSS